MINNVFQPKMKMQALLVNTLSQVFTSQQQKYFDEVAKEIYDAATSKLLEAVAKGYGNSIYINLSLDQIKDMFQVDEALYSYIGIWRALKKICDNEDLIFYEIADRISILTF